MLHEGESKQTSHFHWHASEIGSRVHAGITLQANVQQTTTVTQTLMAIGPSGAGGKLPTGLLVQTWPVKPIASLYWPLSAGRARISRRLRPLSTRRSTSTPTARQPGGRGAFCSASKCRADPLRTGLGHVEALLANLQQLATTTRRTRVSCFLLSLREEMNSRPVSSPGLMSFHGAGSRFPIWRRCCAILHCLAVRAVETV